MLFFVMFFVIASSALAFSLGRAVYSDLYSVTSLLSSKVSYLTAESAVEDRVYKMMSGTFSTLPVSFNAVSGEATTTVSHDLVTDIYTIKSTAKVGRTSRVSVVELGPGAGSAFNYGLQSGNGGFTLRNGASVTGNIYSNGSILGQGSSVVYGDVVSASSTGFVDGIETDTGSVRANILKNSYIRGDAYYNTSGGGNTVSGGSIYTPLTPFPDPAELPISDAAIQEWQDNVSSTITCASAEYLINTNTSLGNVIINCDLRIKKQGAETIVTLTGPVWVKGNIIIEGGPTLKVAPSLGRRSVQIIADNPSNLTTSSKINIQTSTVFEGSGNSSSFIFVISQNNSAESGGIEEAIEIGQSSNGALVLYAGHGLVKIANNIALKSVTGYQIEVGNSSNITYDTGLTSVLFTGGPGGGYVISDWYQE